MSEHFSRNTISAEFWCGKCQKHTQHRIDDRRKGPCLDCIARLEAQHQVIDIDELRRKLRSPEQQELFHVR
jgi:hypothetical protein